MENLLKGLGSLIVGSVVIVGLALLYFMVTAWIVTVGSRAATGAEPSADFVALSAAILTIGGLAGSTVRTLGAMGTETPDDSYEGQEIA